MIQLGIRNTAKHIGTPGIIFCARFGFRDSYFCRTKMFISESLLILLKFRWKKFLLEISALRGDIHIWAKNPERKISSLTEKKSTILGIAFSLICIGFLVDFELKMCF